MSFLITTWAPLTQTDSEVAVGPDVEVKEQVLVELVLQGAVALAEGLLQQQLTRQQDVHVHHAPRDLGHRREDPRKVRRRLSAEWSQKSVPAK